MGVGFPLKNLITQGKRDDTGRILQHPVQVEQRSTAERVRNLRCSDQHLLANCNTCHLPNWQCSECDKSDHIGPEFVILPKAPRKSRIRNSKDGIIVPYDMPLSEFEKSPECNPVV
ncbi:phd finger protein [Culex quinquefasciatus]|uniref:Phd finger protein n=1 Tax=Culex quinquefasciatus TaxID=7176 RepID=B0X9X7_CULQU|nr:phd finger protein [Culex quinquefasciatus]|eukprot:XP_001866449.1 phd finger protein [Culex quinquefasciatus]